MIQLAINGAAQTVEPSSIKELGDLLRRAVPQGQVAHSLRVNGHEVPDLQLDEFDLGMIRNLEVSTKLITEIARAAAGETVEWIERICGVLESVAADYRMGRDQDGADRLVNVIDALQVLVHLLDQIRDQLSPDLVTRLTEPWSEAQTSLQSTLAELVSDMETGDPLRLADRTGYSLPRCLGSFRDLLSQIPA